MHIELLYSDIVLLIYMDIADQLLMSKCVELAASREMRYRSAITVIMFDGVWLWHSLRHLFLSLQFWVMCRLKTVIFLYFPLFSLIYEKKLRYHIV